MFKQVRLCFFFFKERFRVSLWLTHTVDTLCTLHCSRWLLRRLLCLKSAFGLAEINQVVLYRELLLSDWEPRLHLNHQHPRANSHRWFSFTIVILRTISASRHIWGQFWRCTFTPLSLQLCCFIYSSYSEKHGDFFYICIFSEGNL